MQTPKDDFYTIYFCSNCDTIIGYEDNEYCEHYKFCPNCGQDLDWGTTE